MYSNSSCFHDLLITFKYFIPEEHDIVREVSEFYAIGGLGISSRGGKIFDAALPVGCENLR